MEYVSLRNGVRLPMIGFGTFPLKGEELKATIHKAFNSGYSLFDSAFLYQNEQDIGDCIACGIIDREKVLLTSKMQGVQYTGHRKFLHLDGASVSKIYREACNKFHTDHLDIFLLHSPFNGCSKAYKELMQLYKESKVKVIGVSNFNEKEIDTLYSECGDYPLINQIELHPYNTMKGVVKYCKEHEIQVEAYSPFGRGNLVSVILNNPKLQEIASAHNKTVGQVVLRWIVQQGIITIPRSTNEERMKQNLDVFDFTLTEDEMKYVDSLNQNKGFGAHFQNK